MAGLGRRFNNDTVVQPLKGRQNISQSGQSLPLAADSFKTDLKVDQVPRSLSCHPDGPLILIICSLLNLNLLCYGFLKCFSAVY